MTPPKPARGLTPATTAVYAGIVAAALLATIASHAIEAAFRTFTSIDGRTINAKLVAATETEVRLVREDGKSFSLDPKTLSDADREYVAEWRKSSLSDDSPGSTGGGGFSLKSLEITKPKFPGTPEFYEKEIEVLGIPIQGSGKVTEKALRRAAEVVYTMTGNEEVRRRMERNKARVTILAESEILPDMPERAHLKGKTGPTGRTYDKDLRGLGGTKAVPVATVPEDNVLHLSSDRKPQANVLVHEFGHSVMNLGLDSRELKKVEEAYEIAMKEGLWKDAYASNNAGEYFAESTQCYFDAQQRNPLDVRTRRALKEYDPRMHDLLASIFGDRELPDAEAR